MGLDSTETTAFNIALTVKFTENQTLQAGDEEAIDGRSPTGTTRPIEGPQPRLNDSGVVGSLEQNPT